MIFPQLIFVYAAVSTLATAVSAGITNQWYPDWGNGNNYCVNDGQQPAYIVGNYDYDDVATCCAAHFGWVQNECVVNSPVTPNTLFGSLGVYPEYTGLLDVSGTFEVSFFTNGTLCFEATLAGLEASCVNCGIHIHSGTSCAVADDVGGHYFSGNDPWTTAGGAVYNSTASGTATVDFSVDSGFNYNENLGHAVVVHEASGGRVACGVLQATAVTDILYASLATYPGYSGSIAATGNVQVNFASDGNSLTFSYNLAGLESDCTNCGIHIHTGTTCSNAADVGGHYFSGTDPWTTAGGAVYDSNTNGDAAGSFTVTSGFDRYAENLSHAVVVHAQDGTRISCGLLQIDPVVVEATVAAPSRWFPDWQTESCRDDEANAPQYMINNPTIYLHATATICCDTLFSWRGADCIAASASSIPNMLFSHLTTYPDYAGPLNPTGNVKVTVNDNNSLTLAYNLANVETACNNCGIHIHTGTTCAVAADVGGHYFNVAVDPWTTAGGAVFSSSAMGTAEGSFTLTSGYNYAENLNHAVVVHQGNGTRIACGTLGTTEVSLATALATTPTERFFYPDWGNGNNFCRNDGNAPTYISSNPRLWMFQDLDDCCERYFSYDTNCASNSPVTSP